MVDRSDNESIPAFIPDDEQAVHQLLESLFAEYQDKLLRMIEVRLHPELKRQVDTNDILQEAFLEAFRQLTQKVSGPKGSSLVWLRLIVGQELIKFHRRYLQAQKRNIVREVSMNQRQAPATDSLSMSGLLIGKLTGPSHAARRAELIERLRECLDELSNDDREILSLRHFEQLSNTETAQELGITPNAASARYIRSLKKFREILQMHHLDELIE